MTGPTPDLSPNTRADALPVAIPTDPAAELAKLSDTGRVGRIGLWALAIGFGGFILWAAFAPLDQGVPTQGMVAIDTKRKAVQHLQGGVVKQVMVREGDQVKEGDLLVKLGDATVRANWEAARQQYFSLRAAEGRLSADQSGASAITFDPALLEAAAEDPVIQRHIAVQQALLRSRRGSLAATLGALRESARGQEALITGYQDVERSRQNQMALLQRELSGVRDLVAEGYAPLVRQLELERQVGDLTSALAELRSSQIRTRQSILEIRQREISAESEYRKEVDRELSNIRPEVQASSERYKALTLELERTEIRSPATGQVVGLSTQTVGGVVAPGQKLMDIVPDDDGLVLETKVMPQLIDRIKPGDLADLRFYAFPDTPQLVVEGRIETISADVLNDSQAGAMGSGSSQGGLAGTGVPMGSYYLARVSVTPEGMQQLSGRKLQAGMPVEVVIKTGSRTLLQYLLHPLTKRMAASLKEE
jgi:protease secretion system membrane fusion protein